MTQDEEKAMQESLSFEEIYQQLYENRPQLEKIRKKLVRLRRSVRIAK